MEHPDKNKLARQGRSVLLGGPADEHRGLHEGGYMIRITDDFYIDRDAYNWIIKQRVTVRNKEKQTEREELQMAGTS